MKKEVVGLFLLLVICSLFVSADIIVPGTKEINIGLKVDNLENFPNYTFFLKNDGPMGTDSLMILDSDIVYPQAYKFSQFYLCALKEKDFDPLQLDFEEMWNSLSDKEKDVMAEELYFFGYTASGIDGYLESGNKFEHYHQYATEIVYLNLPSVEDKLVCFDEPIPHYGLVPSGSLIKEKVNFITIEGSEDELDLVLETKHVIEGSQNVPPLGTQEKRKYTFFPFILALIVFLIEWPIFAALLKEENKKRELWYPLLVLNIFTVVLANLIPLHLFVFFLLAEVAIVFIEALAIKFALKVKFKMALLASFVANLLTAVLSIFALILVG